MSITGRIESNISINLERLVFLMENCPVSSKLQPKSGTVITTEALSKAVLVSSKTISRARNTGKISSDLLDAICQQLNVDPDYLLGKRDHYLYGKPIRDYIANIRVLHEKHQTLREVESVCLRQDIALQIIMKDQRRIDNNGVFIPSYDDSIDFQREYKHKEAFAKYLQSYLALPYIRPNSYSPESAINEGATIKADFETLRPHVAEIMHNVETQSKTLPTIIKTVLSDIQENNYVITKDGVTVSMYGKCITSKYPDVFPEFYSAGKKEK